MPNPTTGGGFDQLFVGPVIHAPGFGQLELWQMAAIGVDSVCGEIRFLESYETAESSDSPSQWADNLINEWAARKSITVNRLRKHQFLIPGLIDTHTHAPQYLNLGLGLDLPLLDWLQKYTFPRESEFSDTQLAERVYSACVRRHVSFGSTTCCYYGTIHLEADCKLVDICERIGQRALVGKVNMDRNSPQSLTETAQQSIHDTRKFVEYVISKGNSLITPVITPRFAPSCTPTLLEALGELATEFNIPIQSHLSENRKECGMYSSILLIVLFHTLRLGVGIISRQQKLCRCLRPIQASDVKNNNGTLHLPERRRKDTAGRTASRSIALSKF